MDSFTGAVAFDIISEAFKGMKKLSQNLKNYVKF